MKSGSLLTNRSQLLLRFIVLSDFSKYNQEQISSFRIDQGFQFFLPFLFSHCSVFKMQSVPLIKLLRSQATYLLYHISGDLSSLFSNFFEVFSSACGILFGLSAVSLDQVTSFIIIPHFWMFVKRFSKVFLIFLSRICDIQPLTLALQTPVRLDSELVYYTTFRSVCQEVFQNFFPEFSLASLH